MAQIESIQPYLEPVRKSAFVKRMPADAFDLFTANIASWWPGQVHSVSQDRLKDVVFETVDGGRIYEVRDDGETFPWGDVLTWEPPHRFVMHWYPGRGPDTAQEVELRFIAQGDGTRVELEHRNWQSLGEKAAATRAQYEGGWDFVLGQCFSEACAK